MNIMNTYRNWRTYRNTVAELGRLSNRELDDIGISRINIRVEARKASR